MMALLNYSLRIIGFLLLTIQKLNGWSAQVVVFLSVSAHLDPVSWRLPWLVPSSWSLGSWWESIKTFRPLLEASPCCPAGHCTAVLCQKLSGQFGAAWLITPSPGQLSGLCFQGKWWTWNMTVCYDPIFPDISFYWLFEILMLCDEWT